MKKGMYFIGAILLLVIAVAIFKVVRQSQPPVIMDAENPLALEVTKVRSYYHAIDIQDRLKDMGLKSYLIALDDSVKGGKWYKVLVGAKKDSVGLATLKKELETNFRLKELEVVNYQEAKDKLVAVARESITEHKKINTQKPDIPAAVYDVISKFPNSNMFFVDRLFVFYNPKTSAQRQFLNSVFNNQSVHTDLPRGIDLPLIWAKADAFAEAIYTDNIYGDRLTMDILKLKPSPDSARQAKQASVLPVVLSNEPSLEMVEEFADKILATGEYPTEQKEAISVPTHIGIFRGFKVTIEPKKDQLRTYLVLMDELNEYILLCQSTAKTDEELFRILKDIGRGAGMIEYREFYNCFYILPEKFPENDLFLGFFVHKLGYDYAESRDNAKWALEMVGHWTATGVFYNTETGGWICGLFDLLTPEKAEYIYKTLYASANYPNRAKLTVHGVTGFLCQIYGLPYEVNFSRERYACAICNNMSFTFSKKDLLERAETLQFEAEPVVAQADSTIL